MYGVSARCGWTLSRWRAAWRRGELSAREVFAPFLDDAREAGDTWITRLDAVELDGQLDALGRRLAAAGGDLARLPLYGVPFAVKDNIDVAGWPTTAACPGYSYQAARDATVVRRLRDAGAVLVGKTNLDQFATGLVGTRSPHGPVVNPFNSAYIAGGSSSGSAAVVARGLVPFSLGTDTAGSGRVPAAFQNIVGLKPTRGWLSTTGVVPACRTLDCVSVFALTVEDAQEVAQIAGGYDAEDPYSRTNSPDPSARVSSTPRVGVPASLTFFDDLAAREMFLAATERLSAIGAQLVEIDFEPFSELAALLYEGPWIAERYVTIEALLQDAPEEVDPIVRSIVERARRLSASDAFKAEYRRAELARRIEQALADVDMLVVPTTPTIYTIAEVEANPVTLNSRLGIYTNFTNLADLAALALPCGFRSDGLPAGITLMATAGRDHALADFGKRWQRSMTLPAGITTHPAVREDEPLKGVAVAPDPAMFRLAVVGAHLSEMPLNHQLTDRGAVFVERCRTAPCRLYALAETTPPKPALVRDAGGQPIEVELWDLPAAVVGDFIAQIPAPLGIGTVELADGRSVKGFICEPRALHGARDITAFRGWRAYLASLPQRA
jgi:allophanate hydrolase